MEAGVGAAAAPRSVQSSPAAAADRAAPSSAVASSGGAISSAGGGSALPMPTTSILSAQNPQAKAAAPSTNAPAAAAAPPPNRHGAKRQRVAPTAAEVSGIFGTLPPPPTAASAAASAGATTANGAISLEAGSESAWVGRFRQQWREQQQHDRLLLRKPPPDAPNPGGGWRVASKWAQSADHVLRHWRQPAKRQRLFSPNPGAPPPATAQAAAEGEDQAPRLTARFELSDDEEAPPFAAQSFYPSTSESEDEDDQIAPTGKVTPGLSWNAFQQFFRGHSNAAVSRQWARYQAAGGRWVASPPAKRGAVAGGAAAGDSAQESTIQRSGVRELPGGKTKRLGPWTGEEDALLLQLVTAFGLQATEAAKPATGFAAAAVPAGANPNDHGWGAVAVKMGMRTSKQCRERWRNYVDPALRKGAWAKDEQALFVEAHKALGNACTHHDHCWHPACILPSSAVPAI